MQTDVLILGAGPAGSALARQLADAGFAVALADQKAFPRAKPCGEFLSPECHPYLAELGLSDLCAALGAHDVDGMRLFGAGHMALGRFRTTPARARRPGVGVRRDRFDHALVRAAEAAGATFLPRHEFVALARGRDGAVTGAELRTPDGARLACRARFVVGADGVHSRVARALDLQRPVRWLDQFALVNHFDGVPPLPTAEVHLLRGGFFAATTVDGGVFGVNLVLPRHALAARRGASWDEFFADWLARAPGLAQRLVGARRLAAWRGTGPFAFTTRRQAVPGAALVGDAAGYVDPLTGEGIYFALFGARALGEALAAAFAEPLRAAAALRGYERARAREIGPRLAVARALQRGLRHPWLIATFVRALGRWPLLADLVVTLSGDTAHPRELWRPAFWRAFREVAA